MKIIAIGVIVASLSACATSNEPLPSANYVFQKGRSQTKDAITSTMLGRGYDLNSDSDQQLSFSKDAKGIGAVLFSSDYDSSPDVRISYTMVGDNPTTVYSKLAIVTNAGSGFEKTTSLDNNKEGRDVVSTVLSAAGGTPVN